MEHKPCLEDQLVLLEATIEDNKEMKGLLKKVLLEEGLDEAVTMVVSSWGKEQRARAQQEVNTRAGPYWKVGPTVLSFNTLPYILAGQIPGGPDCLNSQVIILNTKYHSMR